MARVTIFTVIFEPNRPILNRIRDAITTAKHHGDADVLVIDNSPTSNVMPDGCRYLWSQGYNEYLAGGMNRALDNCDCNAMAYFCPNHGRMFDPTWLADLLEPLDRPGVAMTGDVRDCDFRLVQQGGQPENVLPQIHVQGGLWAARKSILDELRFHFRYPTVFCDIHFCRRLIQAGYKMASVPSVASVGSGVVTGSYKYVHDYRDYGDWTAETPPPNPDRRRGNAGGTCEPCE